MKSSTRVSHILGLGCDASDAHLRITRGEQFDLIAGSEKTHQAMQTFCLGLMRRLNASGRRLEDLSQDEFLALLQEPS